MNDNRNVKHTNIDGTWHAYEYNEQGQELKYENSDGFGIPMNTMSKAK